MEYQQLLTKVNGSYSLYSLKKIAAGENYCCLICGKPIQRKEIVYYKSSNLQLCRSCAEKTRQPNIPLI